MQPGTTDQEVNMSYELNDIYALNKDAYAITLIKREGLELYAVVHITTDEKVEVIHSFFEKRYADRAMFKLLTPRKQEA